MGKRKASDSGDDEVAVTKKSKTAPERKEDDGGNPYWEVRDTKTARTIATDMRYRYQASADYRSPSSRR